jgi:hypothetical protein
VYIVGIERNPSDEKFAVLVVSSSGFGDVDTQVELAGPELWIPVNPMRVNWMLMRLEVVEEAYVDSSLLL